MADNLKFEGWVAESGEAADGQMVWKEFQPKAWEETDIDIRVTHSGICGTDLHVMRDVWGMTQYPLVVGHEIVGVAVRVGTQAEGGIKVGDIVGAGAQADSCCQRSGSCESCATHHENHCASLVQTYADKHRNGGQAQGGHALYHRAVSHFVYKIPDGLAPEYAAPMLCGGATVFTPLRKWGAGPGKTVGVVGVGGLGHFAILFAKAMGAEVVGISRRNNKRDDVLALGADDSIATEEEENWSVKHASRFDIIISTIAVEKMPLSEYIGLLKARGTMVQLGAPGTPVSLNLYSLLLGAKTLAGSLVGSPSEVREMLQFAVDKDVKPWVETRPMAEANQAMVDMEANKARFRYVLTN